MIMAFLAIGIVSAIGEPAAGLAGEGNAEPMLLADGSGVGGVNTAGTGDGSGERVGSPMMKLQGEGQFTFGEGRVMEFAQEGERIQLKTGEHTAECTGCDLNQENGKLMAKMSNGQNAEIKVMPDQANIKALERLQLKDCGEDCSIELKEVGKGDETRMAYEIKAQKESRVFGIFRANMDVEAVVDADTGEVIESRKPWWAFLASEEDETAA